MCQPKYWNKIYSESPELDRKTNETFITLRGERSDFEIFTVEVYISGTIAQIAHKIKKAFDALESYRDCDCSIKLGECAKHISSMSIFQSSGAKSEIIIGRR